MTVKLVKAVVIGVVGFSALGSAAGVSAQAWDRYLDGYHGPYRGRVVDAETKQPIAGAVVVAVWSRQKIYPLHSTTARYAAREALTENDGTFVIHARELEENAPRYTLKPYFQIFFPGYGAYRTLVFTQRGFQHGTTFEGAGVTVGLPPLKTRKDRLENLISPFDLFASTEDVSDAPFKFTPNLVRLVNQEAVSLGLQPYPGPERKR